MTVERDDRILKPVRWVGAVITPILVIAFVLLYLFPRRTAAHWSWTINPEMTAMLMGAGYLAGAWMFWRVVRGERWHDVALLFLIVTAFTWLLGIATLLHWDRFNHSHVSFWLWLFLYVVAPVVIPLLWAINRTRDPVAPEADDQIVARPLRLFVGLAGLLEAAAVVVLFVRPDLAIPYWPWALTPLTARVVAAFVTVLAVGHLALASEQRWSAWIVPTQVVITYQALILLSAFVARGNWLPDRPAATSAWIGWHAAELALFVGLALCMSRGPARRCCSPSR
jgi:hypothetical protein